MNRVLAQATTEKDAISGNWLVTVTGMPPYNCARTYELSGAEEQAAFEGIRRFTEEMQES